jgi:hypothetical protein
LGESRAVHRLKSNFAIGMTRFFSICTATCTAASLGFIHDNGEMANFYQKRAVRLEP